MALSLPAPKELKRGDDFEKWLESVETYMQAVNVTKDAQKKSIVLHLLGADMQEIYKNLPRVDGGDNYATMKKNLTEYYKPTVNPVVERHLFNAMKYKNEEVSEYVAKLRNQARKCNFPGNSTDECIRDKLVATCPSMKVKETMLKAKNLTLNMAIEIWITHEHVRKEANRINDCSENELKLSKEDELEEEVHKVKWKNCMGTDNKKKNFGSSSSKKCYRCGRTNHLVNTCRVPSTIKCNICGKKGHMKVMCRILEKKNFKNRTNAINEDEENIQDNNLCVLNVMKVNKAIKVSMLIEDEKVEFILDTGCPVTILSEKMGMKICKNKMKKSNVNLSSYTGHKIDVLGEATVNVKYENYNQPMTVYIIKGNAPSLLGRDWLQEIRINWEDMLMKVQEKNNDKLVLEDILKENEEIFRDELGTMKEREATLVLKPGATPQYRPARPVPYNLLDTVEQELNQWEKMDIIKKVKVDETTPKYATPLVVVPKPNGKVRLCGDFKVSLNPHLIVDEHPLPKTEDILATIGPVEYVSVIDLSQAYLQLPLDKESQDLCVLNTHRGLYRMKRLPYGVASAPAIFQREMDHLFQGMEGVKCLLDDLIIAGRTKEEALSRLQKVLRIIKTTGLRLKKEKCKFMQTEVNYLGIKFGKEGIKTSKEKVKPIIDADRPENVKDLRSFLGAVTFYSKFIKNLSKMLNPLNKLLKKDAEWKWTTECEESFANVKKALMETPILAPYDPKQDITLITDASPTGLGAVLVTGKDEKPIMYVSRSLTDCEKKYSQIEREGLCIMFAIERLRNFLLGRKFKLITDNKPLSAIITKTLPATASSRLQRWAVKLAEFNFEVVVRRSEQIPVADWLSRLTSKKR